MSHGRDGWVTNAVNGEDMGSRDVKAFRGYLDWTPSDNFEALLSTEYVRARNGAPIVVSGAVPGEALYVVPGTDNMYQQPCTTQTNSCSAPGKYYSANSSVPDISNQDTFGMTLNLSWSNTPIGDVVSITGYKEYDQLEYTDQDGTTQFLDDTRRTAEGWQLSQELRTTLTPTDKMELMVGTFLMQTHYELIQDFRIPFAVAGLRQENKQDQDNWSASLFTQMYYDLSEQLKLQAGLRYTVEETEMAAGTYSFLDSSGFVEFGGGSNIGGFDDQKTERWENLGGKIGLDYQLNADMLLYGYFAHGFKSGGFVGRVGTPLDIGPYDPEKVDTFEIGFKGDFFDGLMRSNLAVFTTEYDDMQLAQIYFARDSQGNVVQGNSILNAATSSIEGAELELTFLPADGLTISTSLAYLKAEYDEFDAFDPLSSGTRDLSGLTLQNSPEFSANISASYEFSLGAGYSRIKVEYQYSDEKYLTSIDNAPRTLIDSTEIINLNLDWTPQHDQWSIGVWARNLTDERYIASAFDAAGTLALVNYAAPRELGVSMKFNW
jgi:iron complex outermembrane receptor protein